MLWVLDMKVIAIIPFKYESTRLPEKNFKPIAKWDGAPPLWLATYYIVKQRIRPEDIYIAIDEKPETLKAVHGKSINVNVYREEYDYPKGNSLGEKLSYFIEFLTLNNRLVGVDYILVPQVDCWPKKPTDMDVLVREAKTHPNIDYWVSVNDCVQNGNWRLIKVPLRQEVMGQTIGTAPVGGRFDIHTKEDLEELQKFYEDGFDL